MNRVLLKFLQKLELIDHEKNSWYLFSEGNDLILSAVCDFSFTGYDFIMKLDETEKEKYQKVGSSYIKELSEQINRSTPISQKSNSKFKHRSIIDKYSKKCLDAITRWEKKNNEHA